MSSQGNVFLALQPEKRKKKTPELPKNTMFASFVNNPSTSAWGDDSDDEMHVTAAPVANEEDEEEDEEESEEEESEEDEKPTTAFKKVAIPTRTLSKKEKKELEMKEFEAALADLGIPTDAVPLLKTKNEENKEREPLLLSTTGLSDKKKKKKKGKKSVKMIEPEMAISEVVDIKAVLKTKSKKKKTAEPIAVRIAREEKAKSKNKGKKDKSNFNEFSI